MHYTLKEGFEAYQPYYQKKIKNARNVIEV